MNQSQNVMAEANLDVPFHCDVRVRVRTRVGFRVRVRVRVRVR